MKTTQAHDDGRRRFRGLVIGLGAVTALLLGLLLTPASAAGTSGGQVEIRGLADSGDARCALDDAEEGVCLPVYPGSYEIGDLEGTLSGSLTGVDAGTPWEVTFVAEPLTAEFVYGASSSNCPTNSVESDGWMVLEMAGQATGTYGVMDVTGVRIAGFDDGWGGVVAGTGGIILHEVDVFVTTRSGVDIQVIETGSLDVATEWVFPSESLNCDGRSLSVSLTGSGSLTASP